jgi:hypothetical protein
MPDISYPARSRRDRECAANRINEIYERLVRSDVRYRFVIDSATIQARLDSAFLLFSNGTGRCAGSCSVSTGSEPA